MAKVRGSGTRPELAAQALANELGAECCRNVRGLPGSPDLVFESVKRVVFVHGCFWHRHTCRSGQSMPATRRTYWRSKLTRNRQRDRENYRALRKDGWRILVLWECQLRATTLNRSRSRLRRFLDDSSR